MEYRYNKRVHPSSNQHSIDIPSLLHRNKDARELHYVPKTILGYLNKIRIPVATVASSFLFSSFAKATEVDITTKHGILSPKTTMGSIENISNFVNDIKGFIQWFKNIKEHIYEWSLDLLSFTYEVLVNVVLQVPTFLFNNTFVKNTSMTFSIVSISIVILLTIYEIIMKMLKKKHTDFKTIMKRFPIAVGVTGFAPYLFEKAFSLINRLTRGITQIGGTILDGKTFADLVTVGEVDTIVLLLFDVTLLGLLIPIFLQQGKRWWQIFCLSAISPLAMTAWIFDRHSHMFQQWWDSIKRISVVQLVYATFIVLLGVFIYGTRFIQPEFFIIKLIIVIGALQTLANPPQIVKSYTRGDEDVVDMYDGYKKTAMGIYNTVTLRNFKPMQFFRNKSAEKAKKIAGLRKKHNRRFVGDLI